jgi:VanZ family protein
MWSVLVRFSTFQFPVLAYSALIFFLSSGPVEGKIFETVSDVFLHAVEYGVHATLVFWALHEGLKPAPSRGGYWAAALISAAYGVTDEVHQSFVPSRQASVADVMADWLGIGLGLTALWVTGRWRAHRSLRSGCVKAD